MRSYEELKKHLELRPYRWLVTGVAGFIGSNLLETLLRLNQKVVGLDNFSLGNPRNVSEVLNQVTPAQRKEFLLLEGDIRSLGTCQQACEGIDFVLHQAALGSVPRSIEDPLLSNDVNVSGFLNMLVATRDSKVKRFVYAASSSTYGDAQELPKVEHKIGNPLSPYAVTKYVNELYADVFARAYGVSSVGLRYFNVFGKRQDPNGAYAAVIPKWIASLIENEPITIYGDGHTTRDFCYIDNAVQANLLAAFIQNAKTENQVFNIAVGESTSLNQLYALMLKSLTKRIHDFRERKPSYQTFRAGDVRHSLADIQKAKSLLGYQPTHRLHEGLEEAMDWYIMSNATASPTLSPSMPAERIPPAYPAPSPAG